MSFETAHTEEEKPVDIEIPLEEVDTMETIDAKLAALGDPDDPWAEPEAVNEREKLLAKKEEILKQAEAGASAAREAKAAIDRAAGEQAATDEAKASALAEQIKSGEISAENPEQEPKIPSDVELLDQYSQTISFGGDSFADSMPDNIRFSRMAMLTLLNKNIDNVVWVPAKMLREPSFKKVLEAKFNEVNHVKDPAAFEKFYAALLDPDFNLLLAEPKWKDHSAKDIELMKLRAKEDSERPSDARPRGSVLQQYYKEREQLGK